MTEKQHTLEKDKIKIGDFWVGGMHFQWPQSGQHVGLQTKMSQWNLQGAVGTTVQKQWKVDAWL